MQVMFTAESRIVLNSDFLKTNQGSIVYRLGETSRVAEGHECSSGIRGYAPPSPRRS